MITDDTGVPRLPMPLDDRAIKDILNASDTLQDQQERPEHFRMAPTNLEILCLEALRRGDDLARVQRERDVLAMKLTMAERKIEELRKRSSTPSSASTVWCARDISCNHLNFEAPIVGLRWNLSINRYGPPMARLYAVGPGGGPLVLEQDLPVQESDSDAVIRDAAYKWAEAAIADGSAIRRMLFPPANEPLDSPDEEET